MKIIFSILFLCVILTSCGGLEIKNYEVERFGLLDKIGFKEDWTVTGTIQNTSNSIHRNITLNIKYFDNEESLIGEELLPIDIIIPPNAVERFEVKTKHAPKGLKGYQLNIVSSNTQ